MTRQRSFMAAPSASVLEARRRALTRIDMSRDPLPPPCRMYTGVGLCERPSVVGLKRPDSLTIVYVCAAHVRVGERSLI